MSGIKEGIDKIFSQWQPDSTFSRPPQFAIPESLMRNPQVKRLSDWLATTEAEIETDRDHLLLTYSLLSPKPQNILDVADEAKESYPEADRERITTGCYELAVFGWAIIGNEIEIRRDSGPFPRR